MSLAFRMCESCRKEHTGRTESDVRYPENSPVKLDGLSLHPKPRKIGSLFGVDIIEDPLMKDNEWRWGTPNG